MNFVKTLNDFILGDFLNCVKYFTFYFEIVSIKENNSTKVEASLNPAIIEVFNNKKST